jgi:F-box domain
MNLLVVLSDVEGGPLGRIVEFLGHHDAVAFAGTCKSLRITLLGDDDDDGSNHDSSCLGWKAIVLETLRNL